MERRTTLALAASAVVAAVTAACGGAARAVKSSTTKASTGTTARVTIRSTTTTEPKATTTTGPSPTTTTRPSTSTTSTPSAPGPGTTAPTTTTVPRAPSWPAIAPVSALPIGGTLTFTFRAPSAMAGQAGILYRSSATQVDALDTVCTHLGGPCVPAGGQLLQCQWHGSQFSIVDGSVARGPAVSPLGRATVEIRSDGYVWYVADV